MGLTVSVGVLSVSLRVITFVFLFLLSSECAENSSALLSPPSCFDESVLCLMSVEYPLERSRDNSCGYPGFEVGCFRDKYEGRPFVNISNRLYHVLNIFYKEHFINLVDIDAEGSGGGCPQPKRNFSFPSSPPWVNYHFHEYDYVTIFYDCSRVPVDAAKHLLCSKQDYKSTNSTPSYAFYSEENSKGFDWYENCAQNVVVPVFYTSREGVNYSDAIKFGFYMKWSATDWCEDCERSGGRCWSIHNSTATGCSCENGKSYYNKTCPQGHLRDVGNQYFPNILQEVRGFVHNILGTSCEVGLAAGLIRSLSRFIYFRFGSFISSSNSWS